MSGIFNIRGVWWRHYIPILILNAVLLMPQSRKAFIYMGWRWAYVFSLSFALSFCLTPLFRWLSHRLGILDRPDARKIHQEATPLLGGAAVFSAFLAAIMINGIYSPKLGAILTASCLLFVLGVVDDFKEISAKIKLVVQIICAVLVMSFGVVLRVIPDNMGIFAQVGNVALTLFWLIGITNAMNFFDGMDGMAAGLGVIISFFLGVVAFQTNQPFLGWVAVAMMGSCIGFLPYNLLKKGRAIIFLGDGGSTVIGFILASVAVYGEWAEGSPLKALASPLLIFWVLIFDMVYITVNRILSGKVANFQQWLDYVGKDHLHHRLAVVLGGQRKSVLFIYLMSLCLGTSAVVLRNARPVDALLLLAQAAGLMVLVTILERRGRSIIRDGEQH
ncbi:MAG: undecaprenyl/decaprenyl-phosphate alpha-N-acetylglucosaminyl 1-phosphate transferase [Desulfobacterales bacterium]|uniref:Undecaprenyl/decaprenyl-phosphate alpha-N-acetylglucosaminyl 1-phosphate transferase n=1 Tax=Candidatus Desulfatibia vada TaxID=2841696 RepID=A0A8J6NYS4_9BACT|nr:undecaprenyl/decaprenyl-phosphate alpha-N-acetylglucosaminyl 1-phosphate transferase [Candidatus Desulfatibia vada]